MPPGRPSVVITRPEHVASIRKRLSETESVTTISEADLVQAQGSVLEQRPSMVLLHADFAATSRGATLVSAIKAADLGTAIRVFIEDEGTPLMVTDAVLPPSDVLLETSRPLERAGTRQATRYPMNQRRLAINGDVGELIDLSVCGAQVRTMFRLRPMKVARLVIPKDGSDVRVQGTVAWATAVPTGGAIQYRAGIEFVNPDRATLAEFCTQHGGAPDSTLGVTARTTD
jgi:hypothetical protein